MEPRSFCKDNISLYRLIIAFLSVALIISHSAFPVSVFRSLACSLSHCFSWDAFKSMLIAAAVLLGLLNTAWNDGHSNTHPQYTPLEDHATEEEEDFINGAIAAPFHDPITRSQNVRQRTKIHSGLEQHAMERPDKDQRHQRSSEGRRRNTSIDIHQQYYYYMDDNRRFTKLRGDMKNSSHNRLSSGRHQRSTSLDRQNESRAKAMPPQRPIMRSGSTPTIYSHPYYTIEEAGYKPHLSSPTFAMIYNPEDQIERNPAIFPGDGEDSADEDTEDGLIFSPMSMGSPETSSDEISKMTQSAKEESEGKNLKSAPIKICPPIAIFRERETSNCASADSDSSVNKKAEIFIKRFREHIRLEQSESFD